MSNEPKIRDIDVVMTRNPAVEPPILFSYDQSKLTFSNLNHPGFHVNFNLKDPDKMGYFFPDNLLDAMWVHAIDAVNKHSCPTTSMHWSGFEAIKRSHDKMSLTVSNPNGKLPPGKLEQLFAFTLRVTDSPSKIDPVCVPCDPIGTNKNGPVLANNSAAALIVTLLVVGAAAFIGYKLFLS